MTNHKRIFTSIMLVIISMIATTAAFGSTLRVPGDYSTIQDAIDNSDPMDEIVVADGTWTGTGFTEIKVDKPITLRSENGPSNCVIDCNGSGTAIHMSWDTSEVSGFTITNAGKSAVRIDGGTLSNCVITGNKGSSGGGIYSWSGSPVIKDNNFANTGAGMYCYGGNVITSSIISNNVTGGSGSAIYYLEEDNIIVNTVIANNSANEGAIYLPSISFVTLINCTLVDNVSSNSPGAVYSRYDNVVVINSIVWNNVPDQMNPDKAIVSYSNVQGGFPGTGNIDSDPMLGNTYHLTAGSPCIDAGTSDMKLGLPVTDFDGFPRPVGASYDIGADEASDSPNDPVANAGNDQIVGDTITLNGSGSSDPNGSVVSFLWNIEHQTNPVYNRTVTSEEGSTILTELKKGFYDVTLMVTDDTGSVNSDSLFFSATGDPLKDFDVNGDLKIGLEEVIYYLQIVANVK